VVAFNVLFDHVARFELQPDADLNHVPNMLLRGLRRLDVVAVRA
jgi:hypothetical protein